MAYMHIENLYKDQRVLLFKKIWATEKIHGTSAWITYKDEKLTYHSGGGSHDLFVKLFDHEKLLTQMKEKFGWRSVKLHGEFYGGKLQKMSYMYGKESDFIMFDIKVEDVWLSFDKVQKLAEELEIEIVDGEIIDATVEAIEEITNRPSAIALKKGLGEHVREGVVLKPLEEFVSNNGKRVIVKNKTEKFMETATPRKIEDPERLKRIEDAKEAAEEWVTAMRLEHVLDKFPNAGQKQTGHIIRAMIEDVIREAEGEINDTREVRKAIGDCARIMFFDYLKSKIKE